MSKIIKKLKKVKIKNLVILIFLLIFNTYAWFVFSKRASTDITAKVGTWKVDFISSDGTTTEDVIIEVDKIFPGMIDFEKEIEAVKIGETEAELGYKIEELRIMDETFMVGNGITEEELKNKINTEYPFTIIFEVNDFGTIIDKPDKGKFKVLIKWPFESGNDEIDTFWGNKAYDYAKQNPNSSSIEIKVKLIAKQKRNLKLSSVKKYKN